MLDGVACDLAGLNSRSDDDQAMIATSSFNLGLASVTRGASQSKKRCEVMKRFALPALAAACLPLSPASANHLVNLGTPYASRGQCEAEVAHFNGDDAEMIMERFPELFDSLGDVMSMFTRAFPCTQGPDGAWYIEDHRYEVIATDWFQRK